MRAPEVQKTKAATRSVELISLLQSGYGRRTDTVAVEEPLEIRLARADETGPGRAISITMRTPGHDAELAAGFLYGENIISGRDDVAIVRSCGPSGNVLRVEVKPHVALDLARLERNFYTSSSCGVCGKASIDAVMSGAPVRQIPVEGRVEASVLGGLPRQLRAGQAVFASTGGLHAVGLFDLSGELLAVHEDVGRHNAFDKLIGARFLAAALPLNDSLVLLSGRASFELIQKAMMAGVPLVAAIGAPSSLAIELAEAAGMTLVAFLRENTFNVYTHPERLLGGAE
ncbi:MAG TPA: formate dehydrogenase accessory sulfurtransferase FdhD [Steroidobacteraceae bacterium]|nr:formate dehydrogenase accessory sulfurtransferase FdhD [Steroidobacteraceae bacterium]